MTYERLLELVNEIGDLLDMGPEALDAEADKAQIAPIAGNERLFDHLRAWGILNALARQRRDYEMMQECVQRHKLGYGGDPLARTLVQFIDSFMSHEHAKELNNRGKK